MVLLDGATSATPIDGAPSTGPNLPNLPKRQKFKISQMVQKHYLRHFKWLLTILHHLRGQNVKKYNFLNLSNFHLNDHFSHF